MKREDKKYQAYLQILSEELVPAMGCTEPIAIAYGAAKAREVLGAIPEYAEIRVSGNIIKNVKSVTIPNTNGLKGIEAAMAAGIVAGKADKKLEVISEVNNKKKREIKEYKETHVIKVIPEISDLLFDIHITLFHQTDYAALRITHFHTNIVKVEKNGKIIYESPETMEQGQEGNSALLNVKDILAFADNAELQDLYPIIEPQIRYNYAIAEEGIRGTYGAGIGKVLLDHYGDNIQNRAKAMAAAGSDARMGGCELPVIIVSGSGNQGITASVPVITYAKHLKSSEEILIRALTLSNLMTIHQRSRIGKLSAYCGAVNAGCASATGIAYLKGGRFEEIAHTIVNSLAIVSGIICDGAKPSCAAKIASAVEAGILGHLMYENGRQFRGGEGIITKDVDETIQNVGRLGKDGMRETDKEIINIMMGCVGKDTK